MDLFVVPTISFRLLYGLLIMGVCTENLIRVADVMDSPKLAE